MPIYEYRCEKCGEVSEFLVLGPQQSLHCNGCGSEDLKKLMSAHNTTNSSSRQSSEPAPGSGCGNPNACGNPGSCCSG